MRSSKDGDLLQEVELTHANPKYVNIRYKDSCESSVSLTDLGPCPRDTLNAENATVGNDANLLHEGNVAELKQSDNVHIPTPIIETAGGHMADLFSNSAVLLKLRKKSER